MEKCGNVTLIAVMLLFESRANEKYTYMVGSKVKDN